jgi:hypothetical protein
MINVGPSPHASGAARVATGKPEYPNLPSAGHESESWDEGTPWTFDQTPPDSEGTA